MNPITPHHDISDFKKKWQFSSNMSFQYRFLASRFILSSLTFTHVRLRCVGYFNSIGHKHRNGLQTYVT